MSVIARALAELKRPAPQLPDGPLQEPPSDHEPRRRGLRQVPPPRLTEPPISVDEVPAVINAAISRYLAEPTPGRMLLLGVDPGAGKTTALVAAAERTAAAGRRVLYAGPRHDFFADLQALASKPGWWYEWRARSLGDDSHATTCRWAPQIERWMHRGYPAIAFCRNARVCGWQYLNQDCPYHAQRSINHPIIFAQHQHVSLRHPLMEQAALLIGDELPLGAFLNPWTIPAGSIVVEDADPEVERLLWSLRELATLPAPRSTRDLPGGWSGAHLLAALGGATAVARLCEEHGTLRAGVALEAPEVRHPDAVDELDYAHLPYLLSLLEQESRAALDGRPDWVRRVRVTPEGLTLLMRRRPGPLPQHIIWADGTGDPRLYERLLGMPVEVVRPRVQMAGRIYQLWASLNNKTTVGGTPEGDEGRQAQARKKTELRAQIDRIVERGYERPALISYKSVVGELAGELEHGHFGAERGTNRLAQTDCLIVVGAPQPPQPQIIEMAAMLFDERIEPFNATWSVRDITYDYEGPDGKGAAWPIGGFWDDPDLQTLLGQLRDAELYQAVHRARPLRRAVDVWLLTNAPIEGLPVDLVSLRELFDAPEGVDPYKWPAVRAWAAERIERLGRVTAPELAERAGVRSATSGRRYLEALATQDGYRIERAPAAGRGRPPLAAVKR